MSEKIRLIGACAILVLLALVDFTSWLLSFLVESCMAAVAISFLLPLIKRRDRSEHPPSER